MSPPLHDEKWELYYSQRFAFSSNYLDYEIPDFRGVINAATPVLVDLDWNAILRSSGGAAIRPVDLHSLSALITDTQQRKVKLLCNDAVGFHRIALGMVGDNAELKEKVWWLTDSHSLWDAPLLEQRIIWATEGKASDRLDLNQLLARYKVPEATSPLDGLREVFQSQFTRLVDSLPFLNNDIAGRRVFREHEYDSPYISAPRRVSARDRIHFKERLHLFVPLIEGWLKYGLAGIGLDVQADIAQHYQSSYRCNVDTNATSVYHKNKIVLRGRLARDFPNCYGDSNRPRDDGSPVYVEDRAMETLHRHWRRTTNPQDKLEPNSSKELTFPHNLVEEWFSSLMYARQHTRRFSRQERCFPRQENDRISLNPTHWGEALPPNGSLRDWADYHAASQAAHFTDARSAQLPHESFPHLKSLVAEYAEREHLPLIVPSSGCKLLVLRIRDIDLLCYLRTHTESEFVHKTGVEGLNVLCDVAGVNSESDFTTSTEWYSGCFSESLPSLTDDDDEYVNWSCRRLPIGAGYAIVGWEAESFYTSYQFFTRTTQDRNNFLAAIFDFKQNDPDNNEGLCWYLTSDKERREEIFSAMARGCIKGFIHCWSAKTIAYQLRKEYGAEIPKMVQGHPFTQEIEQLYGSLLRNFRFRGQIDSFLYATLLPKLCIDPVARRAMAQSEELLIDGRWQQDRLPSGKRQNDLMSRDIAGDATDSNIIAGGNHSHELHYRWEEFLCPLLEERCHALGIEQVIPGEQLFERLYTTNAISRNGKPGRPIYEIEKPYTCWAETLDDVKKSIAYAIVSRGKKLVAVAAESFVIEVADDISADTIRAIAGTAQRASEDVLGLAPNLWGDFIETEVVTSWSATAEPAQ